MGSVTLAVLPLLMIALYKRGMWKQLYEESMFIVYSHSLLGLLFEKVAKFIWWRVVQIRHRSIKMIST